MNVRLLEILRQRTNIQQLEEKRKKKEARRSPDRNQSVFTFYLFGTERASGKREEKPENAGASIVGRLVIRLKKHREALDTASL